MKFKFSYRELVKYDDKVGMIIDSIIQDDSINYLVKFSETNEDWLKEDDLVRYTVNDGFNIGDRVTYYNKEFKQGFIVDVKFDGELKYLVETLDRERYWKAGGELHVC
jgi:hypothetical protein